MQVISAILRNIDIYSNRTWRFNRVSNEKRVFSSYNEIYMIEIQSRSLIKNYFHLKVLYFMQFR